MNDPDQFPAQQTGRDPREARAAYYARAASWADDRQLRIARSRGIAWIIAMIATTVALLEALALVALLPLKTVVPYTLLVDRTTGFVQALKGTQPPDLTGNAALTQSLLAQYVIAREGYDVATVRADYRKVALWSAEGARQTYLAGMAANNPGSPLNRLPRSTILSARVLSVSPLGPNSALVRFQTLRSDRDRAMGAADHWVAVVRYRFSGEPLSIEDRLVNPLGFQVVQYRRDQEAPPEPRQPDAPSPDADLPESTGEAGPLARVGDDR